VTLDGGFDYLARDLMGWVAIGHDGADRMPGAELFRELAAAQIVDSGLGYSFEYLMG
jgi:hypothetical protein